MSRARRLYKVHPFSAGAAQALAVSLRFGVQIPRVGERTPDDSSATTVIAVIARAGGSLTLPPYRQPGGKHISSRSHLLALCYSQRIYYHNTNRICSAIDTHLRHPVARTPYHETSGPTLRSELSCRMVNIPGNDLRLRFFSSSAR